MSRLASWNLSTARLKSFDVAETQNVELAKESPSLLLPHRTILPSILSAGGFPRVSGDRAGAVGGAPRTCGGFLGCRDRSQRIFCFGPVRWSPVDRYPLRLMCQREGRRSRRLLCCGCLTPPSIRVRLWPSSPTSFLRILRVCLARRRNCRRRRRSPGG